jgi:hypothetical protein
MRVHSLRPVSPNCQTPPSLTALWSGLTPAQSGIIGYDLPMFDCKQPLRFRPAFGYENRHIPWIWNRYAYDNRPLRLCHIPFVNRAKVFPTAQSVTYGFVEPMISPYVEPAEEAARSGHMADIWMLPRPLSGGEALGYWHTPLGMARVNLGAWRPLIYGHKAAALQSAMTNFPLLATLPIDQYRAGDLGPTLVNGGDGRAEEILVSAAMFLADRYFAEFLYCLEQRDSSLVLGYQPVIDLLLHELAGYFQQSCAHWNPQRERVVDELVLKLLSQVDMFLKRMRAALGPNDSGIVCSDHGMSAVDTIIRPNVALRDLGLLVLDGRGQIDLARSACFYHPSNIGLICFDRQQCGTGSLNPQEITGRLVETIRAATAYAPRIGRVQWQQDERYIIDTFLYPHPGQQARADISGSIVARSVKTGAHSVNNGDPLLDGVFIELGKTTRLAARESIRAENVLSLLLA